MEPYADGYRGPTPLFWRPPWKGHLGVEIAALSANYRRNTNHFASESDAYRGPTPLSGGFSEVQELLPAALEWLALGLLTLLSIRPLRRVWLKF